MAKHYFIDGIELRNVHPESACAGRACVIHSPTEHAFTDWTLHWRNDRSLFERICPTCGCGHPDPDQLDFWESEGREFESVHGCCEHAWSRHQEDYERRHHE